MVGKNVGLDLTFLFIMCVEATGVVTCDGTSASTFALGGHIGVGTIGECTATIDIDCCLPSPYWNMDCAYVNISSRLVPTSWT